MIFCVDNDSVTREMEIYALEAMGFDVNGFLSREELLEVLRNKIPELIILDTMLIDGNGLELLKELRKDTNFKNIPVILTSRKRTDSDKIKGLNMGADDYITKPFGIMEMVARVKAVLRRTVRNESDKGITVGNIIVNEAEHQVFVDYEKVELTNKEFELLVLLTKNKNIVFSRDKIMQIVWKDTYKGKSKVVDRNINKLRHKLGSAGNQIQTVIGIGYRLESRA